MSSDVPRPSDAFELERVGVTRCELRDVEGAIGCDDGIVRMGEDIVRRAHGGEVSLSIVFWGGSADVGYHTEILVQDGDETSAVPIFRPVIRQVRANEMFAEWPDLSGVTAGKWSAGTFFPVNLEVKQVLLIAHRDDQMGRSGCRGESGSAVRSPVGDPSFRASEGVLEKTVRAVVQEVVFPVAIHHDERCVREVHRPRWLVFGVFCVLARLLGPRPFGECFTIERGLLDAMGGQIGDEKGFTALDGDEGESVGPRKTGSPFIEQFPVRGIDEDVVRGVVCEKDDVLFAGDGDAVAVLDWGFLSEDAPLWDVAIPEIALAQHARRC